MSKREEFITAINILSAASQSITTEQRIGLLQQAVQQYGLSTHDADEILKASGLIVGERKNYFEVLGLSIGELQNQSDTIIAAQVDEAHKKCYSESLRAGGLPRPDGRTQEQWRTVLNQARDTLKDPQKRSEHIATLQTEILLSVDLTSRQEFPTPEKTSLGISTPEDMLLIQAGEFQIGSSNERTKIRKKPTYKVYVDTFYMDKYPVTNAQYKVFIDANPQWGKPSKRDEWNRVKKILSIFGKYHDGNYLKHWHGNNFPVGKDDHPVTHISWYAAMAYSQWAGKSLPTEAEWEKAARGGLTGQKYPWGDLMDSNMVFCGKGIGETTSVGQYPANNYGLHDIVGNVWEWCLDEYAPNYYTSSPDRNPVAGASTKENLGFWLFNFRTVTTDRVLRGGSLFTSSEPIQTAIRRGRSPLITTLYSTKLVTSNSTRFAANIGFRCAWDTQLKSNHYKLF
ncbi:MAG: formylglycine-generating enzyme family protein [Candidatus Poribacteria bacterium]|nr:formylglycine-generating enzyme family protein [Candidatus Poribacteria bacterium]